MNKIVTTLCAGLVISVFAFDIGAQSTESLMSNGNMLLSNGAYSQAVPKFRAVIERNPGNFEAWFNLGIAYLNWGKASSSISAFKKAAGLNPRSTEAWSNLAVAYNSLGKTDKALQSLYKAVDYNPRNVNARKNLAVVYINNDRINKAINQYRQIIQIDGSDYGAHLNLAKCLVNQEKYTKAEKYLRDAAGLTAESGEPYWELGNIYYTIKKDFDKAEEYYRKAIAIEPSATGYYENLGYVLEQQKKTDEAIKVWEKSLTYIDDPLKKEKIRERITALESGDKPGVKDSPEDLFGEDDGSDALADLKAEMNRGGGSNKDVERINTDDIDATSDLDDLMSSQKDTSSLMNMDLPGQKEKE